MGGKVRPFGPTYSHGGQAETKFPSIPGTTTGGGNPIEVAGADPMNKPVMVIQITTGTATVRIQGNGAEIDGATGLPDANAWFDVTGDIAMDFSDTTKRIYAKKLPPTIPWYRTNITVAGSCNVNSYVPLMILPGGQVARAKRPTVLSETYS